MVIVELVDVGPFERARVELRPLTLFVGRNSVGKSVLLYTLWALASTPPSLDVLAEHAEERGAGELAERVVKEVEEGRCPLDAFRELVEVHVEALPRAAAVALAEALERAFGAPVGSVVRLGASRGVIRVRGPAGGVELVVGRDGSLEARYLDHCAGLVRESLSVEVPAPRRLRVSWRGEVAAEREVLSLADVAHLVLAVLARFSASALGLVFALPELAALLVDGRAGLARALLKPYVDPSIAKGLLGPDEQYIRLYYRLAEALARGRVEVEMLRGLLRELGADVEAVFERGAYTLRVKTWTGLELPFERAPSGLREALTLALALASRGEPLVVFAEEPESHLHPRAQRVLARLVARSVNALGKTVVITTHSDYLLYTFSNLIALHRSPERASELGYERDELLSPERVAAYLVKQEGGRAVVEPLKVGEEGVEEESFAEVARELADERAAALLAR